MSSTYPFLHLLRRTFFDPFAAGRRNLVYLGTFFGLFGFGMINTVSSYDLGGTDYKTLMAYFGPALIIGAFVYWPLLYMGFSALDGKVWRGFIVLVQILSIAAFFIAPQTPLARGLISGLLLAPFWTAHHISMVQNTTKDNRGFEVSINVFIVCIASMVSLSCGTFFLAEKQVSLAIALALSGMLIGTFCMLLSSRIIRQHRLSRFFIECRKIVHDNPYIMRRIAGSGLFDAGSFALAALMAVSGISPAIMASILIPRVIIIFVLSPLIGKMSHYHRKHAFSFGMFMIGLSWLLLAVNTSPAMFLVATIIYALGGNFIGSSLATGLYAMQKYASMMWSEVFLGVGRALGFVLLLPLLYVDPKIYLLCTTAAALFVMVLNVRWQKKYPQAEVV